MKNVTNSVWKRCRKGALFFLSLGAISTAEERLSQVIEIKRQIPHSGYSEGLDFYQGYLWRALPQKIVKIDPQDGTNIREYKPATEYSESLKWAFGKIWNLSFSDNGLYQADPDLQSFKFKKIAELPEAHGWGIEKIKNEIVVTGNFSSKLYFFNATRNQWTKTLNTQGKDLEDLAFDGERLWTSSFTQDRGTIFSIDLKTGEILEKWELPQKEKCPIIDGLAFDGKYLWITGKECPAIYQAKLPPFRRNISSQKKGSP